MSVASGSQASPDVPDREKASPGKPGNEMPATGPQASSGLASLARGLGGLHKAYGSVSFVSRPVD